MTTDPLLWTHADPHRVTLLLAHGAGAGMESPFMAGMAERLAARGIAVARFEFAYMAARRNGGPRRPPPRADRLVAEYLAALEAARSAGSGRPLLIGGKSLGGRVAAMASARDEAAVASGVVCLGYPFHAPDRPENTRLEPLCDARLPVLVCQGDRDPFGNAGEIAGYDLPSGISFVWLEDGDHDFKPRGRSPATWKGNLEAAASAVADFAARLSGASLPSA